MKEQISQYTIYIGLNDADTGIQRFDTEKYTSILRSVCHSYHIPFSAHKLKGGFFHEDGHFTEENTLALTLVDVEESIVQEIAKDLCAFFNQESIMITKTPVEVVFVQEKLI